MWDDPCKLLLYRFRKAVVWIYFKENVFAQPVAESRALTSIPTIVVSGEAEQSSHLFMWRRKSNRRAVPDANVYFTRRVFPTGHWKRCRLFNSALR